MHTLLLADQIRQAHFLQKGLQYENIPTQIVPLPISYQTLSTFLYNHDGLFVFTEKPSVLKALVEFCHRIKKEIPILVLSKHFDPIFADLQQEYLIKNYYIRPFPFRLMAADMRTYVYQYKEKIVQKVLKVRELELNRETREITIHGQSIYLRNREFALLEFLMMNCGKVLSRGTILENVWDRNASILTNTVDVHINKLRKKIDMTACEKFIRTIPCSGYLFIKE